MTTSAAVPLDDKTPAETAEATPPVDTVTYRDKIAPPESSHSVTTSAAEAGHSGPVLAAESQHSEASPGDLADVTRDLETPEPHMVALPASFTPLGDLSEEERQKVLQDAHNGKAEAIQQLLWSMALDPARGWRYMDMPRQIQRKMIDASVFRFHHEGNSTTRLILEENCETMRAALLAETNRTALERILVDRIVTCWLAAELADADAGFYAHSSDGLFYARRQDNAHRRFLSAIESLAKVQRLMRPGPLMALAQVAQMNIAQAGAQQVNVAAMNARS